MEWMNLKTKPANYILLRQYGLTTQMQKLTDASGLFHEDLRCQLVIKQWKQVNNFQYIYINNGQKCQIQTGSTWYELK